jgi:MFS family permease
MAAAISTTLVMRPVGALIFGLMADRYGRRLPLMLDLVFFSVIEVMSGFAQTFTSSSCCAPCSALAWAASGAWARRWRWRRRRAIFAA